MLEQKLTQTPGETEPALSDLADRLADMDKAEGFYGEGMTERELDDVAGGLVGPSASDYGLVTYCEVCGAEIRYFPPDTQPKYCSDACMRKAWRH